MAIMAQTSYDDYVTLTTGQPSDYLRGAIEKVNSTFKVDLSGNSLLTSIVESAKVKTQDFLSGFSFNRLKLKLNNVGYYRGDIKLVRAVVEFQEVDRLNAQLIMANPTAHQQLLNKKIDGYSRFEFDFKNLAVADNQPYRAVMSGIVDDDFKVTEYYELPEANHINLSFVDKCRVLRNWEAYNELMQNSDEDPTSQLDCLIL